MCLELETKVPWCRLAVYLRHVLYSLYANYFSFENNFVLFRHRLILHLNKVLFLSHDEVALIKVTLLEEFLFIGKFVKVASNGGPLMV